MRIYIEKSDKVDSMFIFWLKQRIKLHLKLDCDSKRLLSVHKKMEDINDRLKDVSIIDAFGKLLLSITSREVDDGYFIEINPGIYLIDENLTVYNYWKLINYGTLEIRGYPLVTDVFNDIVMRINDYYKIYKLEVGGIGVYKSI